MQRVGTFGAIALAGALAACGGGATTTATEPGVPVGHPPSAEPPAHVVGSFSIDVPAITLMPGEEQTPCYIFPLEVTGSSRVVGGGSLTVGPGMHHGNITTRPKTGEGVRPCPDSGGTALLDGEGVDILHGGAVLFGSSTQISGTEWQSFPEGMGYRLRDGFEIVARMHYLNTTSGALTVEPKYTWYTIDEASLTREIAPFAWTFHGFDIAPHSELTVTGQCNFPQPMHVVSVLPHMHKLGTRFTAGYVGGKFDGQLFLDSPGYNPDKGVLTEYDAPGVDLSQGDGATFSCSWNNTLDVDVTEGIGDNEMCILFGYAWPPENTYTTSAATGGCIWIVPPPPP